MKVRIKSFNGELPDYLTFSKEYDVVETNTFPKDFHTQYIKDDLLRLITIKLNNSNHLNGGSWEIVSEN